MLRKKASGSPLGVVSATTEAVVPPELAPLEVVSSPAEVATAVGDALMVGDALEADDGLDDVGAPGTEMSGPLEVPPPPPRAVSVDSARTTGCPRLSTGHDGTAGCVVPEAELAVAIATGSTLTVDACATPPAVAARTAAAAAVTVRASRLRRLPASTLMITPH
jgi:hypothetical protein